MDKPLTSLSLDLDDLWTYLKTHGHPGWKEFPSYLSYAVPRILDILDEWGLKITFFLVAQDAVFPRNHAVLKAIADRGHEIGNHTFHHDPWLHLYSEMEIDSELALAEEHIERVTGKLPAGFRGPGFSFSETVLQVLAQRGYAYDGSTFPNILNPLARMYFLWSSNMDKEERKQREGLFGSWRDGLRPNKAFHWEWEGKKMLEIPVTTLPLFKVPIHASYILFLSTFNYSLAMAYLRLAMRLCRLSGTPPSLLLHPLDFLGKDDTDALSFFPAMRVERGPKIKVMHAIFRELTQHYRPVPMIEYARSLTEKHALKSRPIPAV